MTESLEKPGTSMALSGETGPTADAWRNLNGRPDGTQYSGAFDSDAGFRPLSSRRSVLAFVIVVGLAALVRFLGLSHPYTVYFDETYYANDAVVYMEGATAFSHNLDAYYGGTSRAGDIVPVGAVPGEISWVHPPLGKWAIATGIAIFGKNPLGWRVSAALFGTVLVGLVYVAGMLLWGRPSLSALTAFLVAGDGLALTMSRIAMLDIFAATFGFGAIVALLWNRSILAALSERFGRGEGEVEAEAYESGGMSDPLERPFVDYFLAGTFEEDDEHAAAAETGSSYLSGWSGDYAAVPDIAVDLEPSDRRAMRRGLGWCGFLLGLGLGTKLSTLFVWWLVLAAYSVWSVRYRPPWWSRTRALRSALPRMLVFLVVIPVAIYVLSFARFFAENQAGSIVSDPLGSVTEFVRMQVNTAKYHLGMHQDHPYMSSPLGWPVMARPIALWYEDYGDGTRGHILAVGNPVLWWGYLGVAPALLGLILSRRRFQDAFVLAGYASQYLPWFFFSRTAFFYYMLPAVPFMALGFAAVGANLGPKARGAFLVGVAAAAAGAGIAFYPIWVGARIPEDLWSRLMLFRSWI
jgi:dolichyl-phosphate-mannose-protein mannosyltransferase